MSTHYAVNNEDFCAILPYHPCHCRASSPVFEDNELLSTTLHDDNDYVGLSDDDDEEFVVRAAMADSFKFVDILSAQAEMDTDSCNMSLRSSLSSEDSLSSSVCTLTGSMMVEMDSDHDDEFLAEERSSSPFVHDAPMFTPQVTMEHKYRFVEFTPQPPQPPVVVRPSHPAAHRSHRNPLLATRMDNDELAALGLIPKPIKTTPPMYPASLPFVRCCYDSNEAKGCGKGNKCYHIHCDPAHRCKATTAPTQGRHHEVQVDRPHFVSFDASDDHPATDSLPCHYGSNCKNPHHRECAVKHKFNAAAMKEYDSYLQRYRSYEFELIKYQLSVNKARRELTDEVVLDAFARCGGAELSFSTRHQLASLRPW